MVNEFEHKALNCFFMAYAKFAHTQVEDMAIACIDISLRLPRAPPHYYTLSAYI